MFTGVVCLCIAAVFFHVAREGSTQADLAGTLQRRLAENERLIAELRGRESGRAASALAVEHLLVPAGERPAVENAETSNPDLLAVASRLEAQTLRLEQLARRTFLLGFTAEEHEAEVKWREASVAGLREKSKAADAEAHKLALVLAVPANVTQLSPLAGLRNPALRAYRPYFEAKIRAAYLAAYATEQIRWVTGLKMLSL